LAPAEVVEAVCGLSVSFDGTVGQLVDAAVLVFDHPG
jgi:hypothetical protein